MQERGAPHLIDAVARANPGYVESLYREFQRDPGSVDPGWAMFFAGFEFAGGRDGGDASGAADLEHSYRELGHLVADLDPLGRSPREHPLVPAGGPADADLVTALRETYCGPLGVEYLDIADKTRREWLQERMEPSRNRPALTPEERITILERLIAAETFEQFLQARYPGLKRFSLEGGEALIPLLDAAIEETAGLGALEMVMGMPHRGRLNVLAHILGKPYELILAEFEGTFLPTDVAGDGDVKYHLGYSRDHRTPRGRAIHLSLSSNPSHLEAINSVVEGIVRAKQGYRDDRERTAVVPLLMHGDAAFMGQGSVYETLAMSELPGYTTGGTVHVIVNNQIGFTTAPADYVFTRYPSDPAKVIRAPVFHVNGDDPEAVVQAARLAAGYRQAFHADAFVDFFCYRRYGHNEQDDPTFTQPALYRQIAAHPPVTQRYAERLRAGGVVDEAAVARIRDAARSALDGALARARERKPRQQVFAFGGVWKGLSWAGDDRSARTAVTADQLRLVADALHRLPDGFHPHRRLPALLDERHERVVRGEGIDWATGEMLAYGSLLLEGTPVRLSGQDSVRGTFSHRHAILFDAETGDPYVPLNHLGSSQAPFEAVNSLLSEFAALGFEYGVSGADPRRLVLWEAQFGDFVNGAQVIVDQFIASAESKWQRMSGLVLLLPHGYEGQGPEHSSARLERFLQLCAEDNMQVVNATTPAQFFHVLRRQIHRPFRKPLVVMTPKSLLRHPEAVSRLADLADGAFQLVLGDPRAPDPAGVRRVLLGSGKIFYALDAARQERHRDGVAIVRVEQLYPFPAAELAAALGAYRRIADVCWVQEEPANQGSWTFVRPRIEALLAGRASLRYIGRDEAASPATGSHERHREEEQAILEQALSFSPRMGLRPQRRRSNARDGLIAGLPTLNGRDHMAVEIRVPELGESVTEAVIARWLKKSGDEVRADEPVLELETEKATMELVAPSAGRLEIAEAEGARVKVGTVVGRIAERAEGAPAPSAASAPVAAEASPARPAEAPARPTEAPARPAPEGNGSEPPLSPAVRRLVAEHAVDPTAVAATGKGGRLTKGDVLRHLEERPPAGPPAAAAATPSPAPAAPAGVEARPATTSAPDDVERVPMTPLRRRIAQRLVEAQRTAAILTTFNEVDLSELLALRKRYRERFRTAHGVDLGLMSLFGRACVLALRDVPVLNARIDGDAIAYHRRVHLGIAVSTSRGLVVPVVRNADGMTFAELERAIGELAAVARDGKLVPDQLAGGTFTITNGGVFGSLLSTPILNPPQSGILGMHKIEDRPIARDGQVVIRPMMYVALSYDHRLVDGEGAVTFLVRVKERLEEPARMMLEI